MMTTSSGYTTYSSRAHNSTKYNGRDRRQPYETWRRREFPGLPFSMYIGAACGCYNVQRQSGGVQR